MPLFNSPGRCPGLSSDAKAKVASPGGLGLGLIRAPPSSRMEGLRRSSRRARLWEIAGVHRSGQGSWATMSYSAGCGPDITLSPSGALRSDVRPFPGRRVR